MFYRRERDKSGKIEIKNGKEGKQEKEDHVIRRGEWQRNVKQEAGRKS